MSKSDQLILEQNKKFSESSLWAMQREYFDREGIDAWVKEVPHYVTSNPFLANCYAHMSVRLAQDWVKKHPEAKQHPFYILELGTGSGQLSYYVLKKIRDLKKQLGMEDINIIYVMTDFTESNVKFWTSHPALKPFVDAKVLDFALFDMEKDTTVKLKNSGVTLSPGSVTNPITLYANYIFDTVSHDAFTVQNNEIYASLVNLTTDHENMRNGKPIKLDGINIDYTKVKINENYYDDPKINAVLNPYKHLLKDSNILLPIAGLRAIANLRRLSNNKIFLISTDKGYSTTEELEGLDHPYIDFHGSFSMMVNFHAIGKYFEELGGKAIIQTQRPGVKTNVFYSGFEIEDYPEFAFSVWENVERLSPGDYFILHRNISENFKICKIDTLASHMAFTDWDPHIYEKLTKQVCEQITRAEKHTIDYFVKHMPNLADNFFYMPRTYDVLFDIGVLLHTLRHFKEAIPYYEQSQHYFGEKFDLVYNIAICKYYSGQVDEALDLFKHSLDFNPDSDRAKKFIEFIENEKREKDLL